MKAKEYVKSKMPNARADKQIDNRGKSYWLIRDGKKTNYYSSGDTESKAWVEAKNRLREEESQN